jgi:hypothetical protein
VQRTSSWRASCENTDSPRPFAHDIGVSVRSLHRAFEDAGETVPATFGCAAWQRARDDLFAGVPASQVARRWRYSDSSHFSRSLIALPGMCSVDCTISLAVACRRLRCICADVSKRLAAQRSLAASAAACTRPSQQELRFRSE